MYKSPIDVIYGQLETQLEGEVMQAVQRLHVNVDKEELLRALKHDRGQYEKGYLDAMDNKKWIPVTERLPEEEGWYLVYTTPKRAHKSINKAMFCKGYEWKPEPYWRGAGGHWANVTHWMELPKPPKGE